MSLFQAILDAPEDMAARLPYADWLTETGQPERADLIRIQIRMTELEETLDPDDSEGRQSLEWDRLAKRVHELIGTHPEWRSELPELPGIKWGAGQFWGFTGGFVSSVVVQDGAAFVEQMGQVFAAAPVTAVKFDYPDDATVHAVAASSYLAKLRGLRLSAGECGDTGAAALATSPHAANLTFLAFFMCQVGSKGADSLARSPYFRPDMTLQFSGNPVGTNDVTQLRERFGDRLKV